MRSSAQRLLDAERIRAEFEEAPHPAGVPSPAVADTLEQSVLAPLSQELLEVASGGELVPSDDALSALRDTMQKPNYITRDASRDRLELAHAAGCLSAAVDAAETVNAANSLEKMLAHQLAALHRASLKMVEQLNQQVDNMGVICFVDRERANIQVQRTANSIGRMMTTFQSGTLTLQKLKTGGKQSITVQHIHAPHSQVQVNGRVDRGSSKDTDSGAR